MSPIPPPTVFNVVEPVSNNLWSMFNSPLALMLPATVNFSGGVFVPIPILSFD